MQNKKSHHSLFFVTQIICVLGFAALINHYPSFKEATAYTTITEIKGKIKKKKLHADLNYRLIEVVGPIKQNGLYQIPNTATIKDVIKVTGRPLKPYKMRRNTYKISIPFTQKLLNLDKYVMIKK